ncbi:uncharacterized protein LOC106132893 isoform X2 [Amyelois transitella]|uniref:uncharacterized protein LOC106132893 isoform X2 n=1 Tax=Amyelois transitella TaxID=680683 RepID=UPI00067C1D4D|nr:uncharacterized protein LOC106132893 isoform X2 [Amyelois transitella]
MWRFLFCAFILSSYSSYAVAIKQDFYQKCKENITKTLSCSTQLAVQDETLDADVCKVLLSKPLNYSECREMNFGPFQSDVPYNAGIGGVSLRPYLLDNEDNNLNFTVLNITFTSIKWKTMKFRFHNPNRPNSYHCRNIEISKEAAIDERSVLYYDCYWSVTDENNSSSHYLDFEASTDYSTNRGQYFFNIPNMKMLSTTVSENQWKPFLYIEILSTVLRLHIMPPPPQLTIKGYKIEVRKGCLKGTTDCFEEVLKTANLTARDPDEEVTYDYYFIRSPGSHYFVVTPLHEECTGVEVTCQAASSPKIDITTDAHKTLNICIASITALVVASLFAYYLVLRYIRRFCCKDYHLADGNEIPPPTKVLVIYPNGNRLHAECVASFVSYLRDEYAFDIMYDGDINNTKHRDPFIWAQEAFSLASHILYVVGPTEVNNQYGNIYEKQIIPPYRNVDVLLLSMVRALRATRCSKHVTNVRFEHSNGQLPIETKHSKTFCLLKDWNKMIAFLSKDLLPLKQLSRSEKGKNFIDDLNRAKKLLNGNKDDIVVGCEKNAFEKKILV